MEKKLVFGIVAIVFVVFFVGYLFGASSKLFQSPSGNVVQSAPASTSLPSEKLSATTFIAAVDNSGKGLLSEAQVEIIDGQGRVLFNTNPFVEPDTQYSLETAAKVAFDFSGKNFSNKDVIYSVNDNPAQLIGGPSAGGAFTVATIAAIEGKHVNSGVAMTGTIEEGGKIGPVGGILEKAAAAAKKGIKLFLIPKGQAEMVFYKEVIHEEQQGYLTIRRIEYVPQKLDFIEYAKKELGLEVKEVSDIREAVDLML